MIIHISDEIRIHGTEQCYQIEKLRNCKGSQEWRPFKYYSNFAHALKAAAEREIRTHPAQGLVEAIEAAQDVADKYERLLNCALDEISKRDNPEMRLAS